jgi:hypothetical protein
MSSQTEEFSLWRAWLLTLLLLIVASAVIALANLSTESLTAEGISKVFQGQSWERACGWPLTWYWRIPHRSTTAPAPSIHLQWSVSRYSPSSLGANVAVWLASLLVLAVACQWLLRRYRPPLRWRPQATTLLLLTLVVALTVLANLSTENRSPMEAEPSQRYCYGWPLIWYWQDHVMIWWQGLYEWNFSAAAAASNAVIWLAMLAVIAQVCGRLLRRYPPRFRWSLRTMLGAVALVAALFAWFVHARNRANLDDAVIALLQPDHGEVYFERGRPNWFEVVGADRLRRRLVGVYLKDFPNRDYEVDLFQRLARLPHLHYLEIKSALLPDSEGLLRDMRQLRTLGIYCPSNRPDQIATLGAVGKLTDLERLSASVWVAHSGDLEALTALTKLKSLMLEIRPAIDSHEGLAAVGRLAQLEQLSLRAWHILGADLAGLASLTNLKSFAIDSIDEGHLEPIIPWRDGQRGALADFPALARLESLDLTEVKIADSDLDRLADCRRLTSLCLGQTGVSAAGLARLAAVKSLNELAIDERTLTIEGLESLIALKGLKALHISHINVEEYDDDDDWGSVVLDDRQELVVLRSQLDRLRYAVEALRQANPGIVIDTDYDGFHEREFQYAFELNPPAGSEPDL